MAQATIRDVAREAAVSVASVSRALNGHENVHPETRARVIEVAERLGYVPHAGARSLSLARAHVLGVVLPDLHGEFFSEIVRGMDREASERGYQLLLSNVHADPAMATQALRTMRGRVDGVIIMAPQLHPDAIAESLPSAVPAVLVNCQATGDPHPTLRVDNAAGVEAMVRHLAAGGRRAIAHIAGPEGNMDAGERIATFRAAVARHCGDSDPLILPGDFSEDAGVAAAHALLQGERPVDAVFAANDMMAIGCLVALRDAGIDVPGTIAVAGFDDIPVARYLSLSTIRVAIAEVGARALALLVERLDAKTPGEATIEFHAPELVERRTTGAVAVK